MDDVNVGGGGPVIGANINFSNTSNGGGGGGVITNGGGGSGGGNQQDSTQNNANSTRPLTYTMPGMLHYLQHEWTRFEYERQQWEADKAELLTKISFLQGERRGQENLKTDLIRRIKMLELALKQERTKNAKLMKAASNTDQPVVQQTESTNNVAQEQHTSEQYEIESTNECLNNLLIKHQNNNFLNSTQLKHGRTLLRQYLQEISLTDTIIDVRNARLRNLLLNPDQKTQFNAKQEQFNTINKFLLSTEQQQGSGQSSNDVKSGSSFENFVFNNENVDFNENYDEEQDQTTNERSGHELTILNNIYRQQNGGGGGAVKNANNNNNNQQSFTDLDTEDALKEFSFLSNEPSDGKRDPGLNANDDWNYDKAAIQKLTEEYKKDRKQKQNKQQQQQQLNLTSQRPNRTILQAMIANLNSGGSTASEGGSKSLEFNLTDTLNSTTNLNDLNPSDLTSPATNPTTQSNVTPTVSSAASAAKLYLNEDDQFDTMLNLGELSRISVNNNDDTLMDVTLNQSANNLSAIEGGMGNRRTLSNKYTLRGHFDAIRSLTFHPLEAILFTGSEDQTIKLWNLEKLNQNSSGGSGNGGGGGKKQNQTNDIEPLYTFRGHSGAVLSLLITQSGQQCLSASLDSTIKLWNIPNDDIDPYDAYDPNVFVKSFIGHSDAVWIMCLNEKNLLSASSDSSIRLWNIESETTTNESIIVNLDDNNQFSNGIPTCVNYINNDTKKFICSYDSSAHVLYDLETRKEIMKIDFDSKDKNSYCYKVISHPSNSIIISAHEDKRIRFFDINSGKQTYSMVAHQDSVTDLAIDPSSSLYLLSSSHDCSIRLWNLENKNCIQELSQHRKKYEESIHCVGFHSTKSFIASGAADAIAKVYI